MSDYTVDLRYVDYFPEAEAKPLEDVEVRNTDPVFVSASRYVRAFRLDHQAVLSTSHGVQLANAGDYIAVDETNGLVHAIIAPVFEMMYVRVGLDTSDVLDDDHATIFGTVYDFTGFMRKVNYVMHGRNVDTLHVETGVHHVRADIRFGKHNLLVDKE